MKVSIDQLKSKECFLLIALESENEITDVITNIHPKTYLILFIDK